jgi:hypothetical protein
MTLNEKAALLFGAAFFMSAALIGIAFAFLAFDFAT